MKRAIQASTGVLNVAPKKTRSFSSTLKIEENDTKVMVLHNDRNLSPCKKVTRSLRSRRKHLNIEFDITNAEKKTIKTESPVKESELQP